MNGCVPDWDVEEDHRSFHGLPLTSQRTSMRADHELTELVWQNGHVVMQGQNNRKNTADMNEPKQQSKADFLPKCGGGSANFNIFFEEEETTPWLQYPLDDPLDTEFCTEFFQGMPIGENKLDTLSTDRCTKSGTIKDVELLEALAPKQTKKLHLDQSILPPPKPQPVNSTPPKANTTSGVVNFSHFSRPIKLVSGYPSCRPVERSVETNENHKQVGQSSAMSSKLSSNYECNPMQNKPVAPQTHTNVCSNSKSIVRPMEDVHRKTLERGHVETHDTATVTSSSAGSGSSVGRTSCPNAYDHKRKAIDVEESECQSEETEFQSVEDGKSAQKSKVTRRSRAAEVHNLSERRRRDRINEKMKALQELIPHCNKTDKASMLDEAIEYLKSLQLQVQMMWMGNGMAPMMFPGPQHLFPFMGAMPTIPGAVQMPRVPLDSQAMSLASTTGRTTTIPAQSMNLTNYANQIQNSGLPEAYLRCLGLQNMPSPQGLNIFAPQSSQFVQPNCPTISLTGSSPVDGTAPSENNRND